MPAEVTGPNAPEPGNNAPASNPSANPAPSNERPEWLPEKFESPEALAKAYGELESKLGSQQQQQQPAPVTEQQATQQLQSAGLDMGEFQKEFSQNGSLSEDSYAKLAQAGFSKDFVNDFIRGQEALAEQEANTVFAEVGGQQEFQKVAAWARANLPAAELESFNKIVETAPVDVLRFAVLGLHSKYVSANGQEPRLVNGQPGHGVEGFQSRHEMVEAMRDPRYRKDEAYREQVTRRLAVSNFF